MIALSCFAPFGGRQVNNSQRLLDEVKKIASNCPELNLSFLEPLPVVYDTCFESLDERLQALSSKPRVLLAFGEAPTEKLKLESVATNLKHSKKADEAGNVCAEQVIVEAGPSSIENSIGFSRLYEQLAPSVKTHFELSEDCGQYVCNNLNYRALYELPDSLRFGFIHVSNSKEDLSQEARAVLELIRLIHI
ncbi:hypothetical protein GW915_06730 [bacterium]|nr:hypothetical protein [bacterium]